MACKGLADLLAKEDVACLICTHLSLADVCRLRGVSQLLRGVVNPLLYDRLSIQAALKRFVSDCDAFRWNLGQANALLVGGVVLNFLGIGMRQKESLALDILVEQGYSADNLVAYLCAEEAFEIYESGDVGKVVLSRPESTTQIRVTKSDTFPIQALLQSSCTTADLTFMSWNKVYCVFPLPTFDHHKFWLLRKLDSYVGVRLTELAQQGWTTRDLVWADWAARKPPGLGLRRVGDERSLKMTLLPPLSDSAMSPDYVLELAEFSVGGVEDESPPLDYRPRFSRHRAFARQPADSREVSSSRELCVSMEELASRSLQHRYVIGRERGRQSGWGVFVSKRLSRWTEVETCKENSIGTPASDPAVLWTWDFADDEMPLWFEQYCLQEADNNTD